MDLPDRIPYPGLRAYETSESDLFFGREDCVDAMLERLAETRFLAVLGNSGSGKSSLVRTGLLDALELGFLATAPNKWRVADMHPGGRPLLNLAKALARQQDPNADEIDIGLLQGQLSGGPRSLIQWCDEGNLQEDEALLLLVDQFEELFRYQDYAGREEAEAFVALLQESAAAHPQIHVVLTMRSEYLGACALMRGLAEKINAGLYLTPRLTRTECADAIEGPSRVLGFEIEPRLVNHILNDMAAYAPWDGEDQDNSLVQLARRADQLPLMQHVLNRLWDAARRKAPDHPVLKFEDYEQLGGLRGAVNDHAEEVLATLSEKAQEKTPIVFKSLMTGSNISDAVRAPKSFDDIAALVGDADITSEIIDAFRARGCNFLRPPDDFALEGATIIDLGHESLIRQWGRLRDWLADENRAVTQWNRLLAATAAQAVDEGDLLSGLDLDISREWFNQNAPSRVWAKTRGGDFDAVKLFLDRSIAAEQKQTNAKQATALRERRNLRLRAGAYLCLACLGIGAALFANSERRNAIGAEQTAILAEQVANEARADAEVATQDAVSAKLAAETSELTARMAGAASERALTLAVNASETFTIDVAAALDNAVGVPDNVIDELMESASEYLDELQSESDTADLAITRARMDLFDINRSINRGELETSIERLAQVRETLQERIGARDNLLSGEAEAMLTLMSRELTILSAMNEDRLGLDLVREAREFYLTHAESIDPDESLHWDAITLGNLSNWLSINDSFLDARKAARACLEAVKNAETPQQVDSRLGCMAALVGSYDFSDYPSSLIQEVDSILDSVPAAQRSLSYWKSFVYIQTSFALEASRSGNVIQSAEILSRTLPRTDELIREEPLELALRNRLAFQQYLQLYNLDALGRLEELYDLLLDAHAAFRNLDPSWRSNEDLAYTLEGLIENVSSAATDHPDYLTDVNRLEFHIDVYLDWHDILKVNRSLQPEDICEGCTLEPFHYLGGVFVKQYKLGEYANVSRQFSLHDEVAIAAQTILNDADQTPRSTAHADAAWYWMTQELPVEVNLSKLDDPDRELELLEMSVERFDAYLVTYPNTAGIRHRSSAAYARIAELRHERGDPVGAIAALRKGVALGSLRAWRRELDWVADGSGPLVRSQERADALVEMISKRDWTITTSTVNVLRAWKEDSDEHEIKMYIYDQPFGSKTSAIEEAIHELERRGLTILPNDASRMRQYETDANAAEQTVVQFIFGRSSPNTLDIFNPNEIAEALRPYEAAEDPNRAAVLLANILIGNTAGQPIIQEAIGVFLLNETAPGFAERLQFTQQMAYDLWGLGYGEAAVGIVGAILEQRDVLSITKQVELLVGSGEMHGLLGDLDAQEHNFLAALALKPDDANLLNNIGYQWSLREEMVPSSIVLLERGVSLNEGQDESLQNYLIASLGWAYVQDGDLRKGLETLLLADLADEPAEAEWKLQIGEAHRRMGNMADARRNFDDALTVVQDEDIKSQIETQLALLDQMEFMPAE